MTPIMMPVRPPPVRDRLEYVRGEKGGLSLRKIERLVNSMGEVVKYEALRTYHRANDPVTPPGLYLARFAEVFGVHLPWLITGDAGAPIWEEDYITRVEISAEEMRVYPLNSSAEYDLLVTLLPDWDSLSGVAKDALSLTWGAISPDTDRRSGSSAKQLIRVILTPFQASGREPDTRSEQFSSYVTSVCLGLRQAAGVPDRGDVGS